MLRKLIRITKAKSYDIFQWGFRFFSSYKQLSKHIMRHSPWRRANARKASYVIFLPLWACFIPKEKNWGVSLLHRDGTARVFRKWNLSLISLCNPCDGLQYFETTLKPEKWNITAHLKDTVCRNYLIVSSVFDLSSVLTDSTKKLNHRELGYRQSYIIVNIFR